MAGTVAFSGGTTTLTGAVNDTGNFTINISGGTVDFDNTTDSIPYLNLTNGGTLTGSAAVTVTNTLNCSDVVTMSGTGSTTPAGGGRSIAAGDSR